MLKDLKTEPSILGASAPKDGVESFKEADISNRSRFFRATRMLKGVGAFEEYLEERYRTWQRERHMIPRALLFFMLGAGFAFLPFYQTAFRLIPQGLVELVQLMHLLAVAPLSFFAIFMSLGFGQSALRQSVQAAAVIACLLCVIALRSLSTDFAFEYPHEILWAITAGITLMAGFSFTFNAIILAVVTCADQWLSSHVPGGRGLMEAYAGWYMATTVFAVTYIQESMARGSFAFEQSMQERALIDPLTQLATRQELQNRFPIMMKLAKREHKVIATMLIDLDHFKKVNDDHGHVFGDLVLREAGKAINRVAAKRPLDIKARYGGEELAVALYDVNPEGLPQAAERVLEAIRSIKVISPKTSQLVPVRASIGMVWAVPTDSVTIESIFEAADKNLYEAKKMRNRAIVGGMRFEEQAIVK